MVASPIYSISMQHTPQRGMITTSATVATRGDAAVIGYEKVSNVYENKPSTTITASQLATDV